MRVVRNAVLAMMVLTTAATAYAQASEVPSANAGPSVSGDNRGHKLLDLMVQALAINAVLFGLAIFAFFAFLASSRRAGTLLAGGE